MCVCVAILTQDSNEALVIKKNPQTKAHDQPPKNLWRMKTQIIEITNSIMNTIKVVIKRCTPFNSAEREVRT